MEYYIPVIYPSVVDHEFITEKPIIAYLLRRSKSNITFG